MLAIWNNVNKKFLNEYEDWYNKEHLFERLSVPDINIARRFISLNSNYKYFTSYEAKNSKTFYSSEYINKLNNPSTKTKFVMEFVFKNMSRTVFERKVINGSVSGSTSSGGLNRADWSLSEPGIDLIILGLGANDMLRGIQPEETERNLEQIIKVAQNKKIKIILAGMVAPDTHGEKYKKAFDIIYPKLSKKYNLALIPFLLEGVALNPSLNQQDGIHPNKEGIIKVSETIKKSIINIIN